MKNSYMHKRIIPQMVFSLLLISTLMSFLIQLPPVSAQNGSATLTGVIYDEGVDTDGDGAFDYLNLGVEVDVITAATYRVDAGGLYDTSYNSVSVLTNSTEYLDVGIQVIDIPLNGSSIYAAGVNPTYIAAINLYDSSDNLLDTVYDLPLSGAYSYNQFQLPIIIIGFDEVERKIMLGQEGSIYVTNVYSITNVGFWTDTIELGFPDGAYDFEVRDEMGALETSTGTNVLTVTLRTIIDTNETENLYMNYHIPWENYISQQNGVDYSLQFSFYEQFNSIIGKLTVSIILPKGAEFKSSTPQATRIEKIDSQETSISFAFSDVTPSQNLDFSVNYKYIVFWGSFYPTIWVGILAVVAAVIVFFFGTPKTIAATTISVPPKDLKSFVDTYEEKTTIQSELEALEERLKKGKIPRRRYKVRKKMLDGRFSTVCRKLTSLRDTIRTAGSKYAKMMREIEVAEAKLEGAERDLQRVKARYKRGEVSKGAYGKLLEEYTHRIEEADATIDGVLLRLRE